MVGTVTQLSSAATPVAPRDVSCLTTSTPRVTKVSRRPHSLESQRKPSDARISTVIRTTIRSPPLTRPNGSNSGNITENLDLISTIRNVPHEPVELRESLANQYGDERSRSATRPVTVSRISRCNFPNSTGLPASNRTIKDNSFAIEQVQQQINTLEELKDERSSSFEGDHRLLITAKTQPSKYFQAYNGQITNTSSADSKQGQNRSRVTPTNVSSGKGLFSNGDQLDPKRKKKKKRLGFAVCPCSCSCAICSLLIGLLLVIGLAVALAIILTRNSSQTASTTTETTIITTVSTTVTTNATAITTPTTDNEVTTEEVTTASTSTTDSTIATTQTTTLCPPTGIVNLQSFSGVMSLWTNQQFNYTATKTSPTLVFTTVSTNRIFYLDSVSVVDTTNSSIELLQNPGFDNSSTALFDWLLWCSSTCGGSGGQLISSSCLSGNCFQDACSGGTDYLLQTFSATIGSTYTISFWLKRSGAGGATGSFSIGIF
ncbi:unnamed protein product [Rotaria socialis]|uniref:Uncharacterized protein n=2 Tax=Rotaria socialis TaxID=392032 RepID=A0A817SZY1_9BILA|nr:unnamed protein product [Rotaria socialis]CAF3383128.1 unnamed protein product [Rotaria socialis]CAF4586997.1 unnamed protein product [Rotaria socialis]CAF4843029.1 unnamed protein product [Rotaria socialis]